MLDMMKKKYFDFAQDIGLNHDDDEEIDAYT